MEKIIAHKPSLRGGAKRRLLRFARNRLRNPKKRLLRRFVPRNDTIFEKKVYLAVLKIPGGSVRSYKWVAAKIGRPNAARAVGNALNKNPYTGIVPCHRVIRSDGSIGGFARGAKNKRELLKSELIDRVS